MVDGLYLDEHHRYFHERYGQVPSVTQIIRDVGLIRFPPQALPYLEKAGERGTFVHTACDLYDKGELDWSSVTEYEGYLESYAKFVEHYHPCYTATEEELLYDEDSEIYAGKIDRVWRVPDGGLINCTLNGEKARLHPLDGVDIVLDSKTASELYPSYWIQVAAYAQLVFPNCSGLSWWSTYRGLLHLRKNGKEAAVHLRSGSEDILRWNACRKVYYTKKEFNLLET